VFFGEGEALPDGGVIHDAIGSKQVFDLVGRNRQAIARL
jgi:hypothetical protein